MLQFVTELHFPLIAVTNPNEQINDIPEKLIIGNARNERDNSLEELYIENYSNTEFMSEDDVYEYMARVSDFLKLYGKLMPSVYLKEEYDSFGWLGMWQKHINELSIEMFNSFVFGNLLSVAAMTRSLIECYVYVTIMKKEESEELIDEWWLCNMIHKITQSKRQDDLLVDIVKEYCEKRNLKFSEKWEYYNQKARRESGWLLELMKGKGVGFKALCKYIGEDEIYEDYQSASAFVHGQDTTTKLNPFILYSSIYTRLYLMMYYIFKSISLFEIDEMIEEKIIELEDGLLELGEKYLS